MLPQSQSKRSRRPSDSEPASDVSASKRVKLTPDILPQLLDCSDITSCDELALRFTEIANTLLRHYHLHIVHNGATKRYRLLEVECYLYTSFHPDPFCHAANEQSVFATWYFHKPPTNTPNRDDPSPPLNLYQGFRGGTRKGLDITLSKRTHTTTNPQSVRGGILLRSMQRIQDGRVISGPSLLVDEILRVCGVTNIQNLVVDVWKKNLDALERSNADDGVQCSRQFLHRVSDVDALPTKTPVYSSPRVGLDLSNKAAACSTSDPRVVHVAKPYRFFVRPELLIANGRTQTFYGLLASVQDQNAWAKKVRLLLGAGFSSKTIERWKADVEKGKASGSLTPFVGQKGKNLSSSTYLQMLGALSRLDVI